MRKGATAPFRRSPTGTRVAPPTSVARDWVVPDPTGISELRFCRVVRVGAVRHVRQYASLLVVFIGEAVMSEYVGGMHPLNPARQTPFRDSILDSKPSRPDCG